MNSVDLSCGDDQIWSKNTKKVWDIFTWKMVNKMLCVSVCVRIDVNMLLQIFCVLICRPTLIQAVIGRCGGNVQKHLLHCKLDLFLHFTLVY